MAAKKKPLNGPNVDSLQREGESVATYAARVLTETAGLLTWLSQSNRIPQPYRIVESDADVESVMSAATDVHHAALKAIWALHNYSTRERPPLPDFPITAAPFVANDPNWRVMASQQSADRCHRLRCRAYVPPFGKFAWRAMGNATICLHCYASLLKGDFDFDGERAAEGISTTAKDRES